MSKSEEVKVRIVRGRPLAKALNWLGFEYKRDEKGFYIFERSWAFDIAWKDLHALRSDCNRRSNY